MNEVLRLGVIGCGNMGRDLARRAHELDHAEVAVVSDVSEARAAEMAKEIGAEAITDYAALLLRRDVDAVIIASPPFMHCEMVVAAAAAGKHIFCEKPMAPTLTECDAMIEAVIAADVKFQIGHVCRFHAAHRKVHDLVHSGQYGKPVLVEVHRIGGPWGSANVEWRQRRSGSGGLLLEVNAHELDFMRFVCGDVVVVSAMGGIYVNEGLDYADAQVVLMEFESGAVGCLHSSMASAIGGYGGRVDCTEGSIVFPAFWGKGASIQVKRFDGELQEIPIAGIEVETPVRAELRAFVDAVQADTDTPVSTYAGRAVVEIAEAAYKSIDGGGLQIRLGG